MSVSRSEYRQDRKEQRSFSSSMQSGQQRPDAQWDDHFNSLMSELDGPKSLGGPPTSAGGLGTYGARDGGLMIPGGGGTHERSEYTSPDGTHVVEQRYARAARFGDNQTVSKKMEQKSYSRTENMGQTQGLPGNNSQIKHNILQLDNVLDDLDSLKKSSDTMDFGGNTGHGSGAPTTSTPYYRATTSRVDSTNRYQQQQQQQLQQYHHHREQHREQHQEHQEHHQQSHMTGSQQLTTLGLTGAPHAPATNPLDGLSAEVVPELHTAPQPGTTRVTRYEYRRCDRRQVSPSPERTPARLPGTGRTRTEWHQYSRDSDADQTDRRAQRSPSPSAADTTVSKSYVYERHNQRQRSASPCARFPVETTNYHRSTSAHNAYTSSTLERTRLAQRSPSPAARRRRDTTPQQPLPAGPRHHTDQIDAPKHVEQLMAQIPDVPQDGTYVDGPRRRELNNRQTQFTLHEDRGPPSEERGVTVDARSGTVVTPQAPAVYYPPGSNQFQPRLQSSSESKSFSSRQGGKSKSGYKASGRYKAKAGSKERHSEGGTVIPVCLPLCCGAACNIM